MPAKVKVGARATPWASLAPDHAFQAAQEARQEDHVSRRAPVEMWEMAALLYCAVFALALHCVGRGCSAINLEGSALLKFQSRVEEDPHGAMAGWSVLDADPCGWNGVRCADDRVVMLNLKDLSLRGNLGPELGSLSHLQALVLSNNLFSGLIPKEIGGLATLEILDLSNNNLTGEVPQKIAEMASLKNLLLSNNRFQWPVVQNSHGNFDQETDFDIYDHLGRDNLNQRADDGFESGSSTDKKKKRHQQSLRSSSDANCSKKPSCTGY